MGDTALKRKSPLHYTVKRLSMNNELSEKRNFCQIVVSILDWFPLARVSSCSMGKEKQPRDFLLYEQRQAKGTNKRASGVNANN